MKFKGNKQLITKEDIFQAVVIADDYNNPFAPVTDIPCLMELANRPLLLHTLQCLSSAKVQEVILFCSSHADQIREFLNDRKYGRMTVTVVVSDGCLSLGDAMRDLDGKGLIRGDFVLLTGNVVGNVQLLPALAKHRQSQKLDNGLAMTVLYKKCGKKLRSPHDDIYVAVNSQTGRLIHYERASAKTSHKSKITLKVESVLEQRSVEIRNDLADTGISICSLTVPPLFSDNFDFQTRDDFIRGLIMNEEILSSSVQILTLPEAEYGATVTSWQSYRSVCSDVIYRWTYPHVPDRYIDGRYNYTKKNTYLDPSVALAMTCSVTRDSVIGPLTVIKDKARLTSAVIGTNCVVGVNSAIEDSHVFSNVTIEEDCCIRSSVIGKGCVIKKGAQITGCALGPGVIVEKGTSIKDVRLTSKGADDMDSLGSQSFIYKSDVDDSDSESNNSKDKRPEEWRGMRFDPVEILESDESESDDDSSRPNSPIQDDTNLFFSEVVDSLLRGFEDRLPCDNLVLEINSSRYAYNVTLSEVNYFVSRAILTLQEYKSFEDVLSRLKYFMPLFNNYIRNETAMSDCLGAIEDVAEMNPYMKSVTMKMVHFLYNKDILSEEAILKWYSNPKAETPNSSQIRKLVKPFIDWLENAETSESSD